MAPPTAARNASPAPRAAKKIEEQKQKPIRDENKQLGKKVQKSFEEPQKQTKVEDPKNKVGSAQLKTRSRCSSTCCSVRTFSKVVLAALLMALVVACIVGKAFYSTEVAEIAARVQGVACKAWGEIYQALAGLATSKVWNEIYQGFAGLGLATSKAWSGIYEGLAGLVTTKPVQATADL